MQQPEQDEQERIGPDWLWKIGAEMAHREAHGARIGEETKKAVYFWCLSLEIDLLAIPEVQVINAGMIRLRWGDGRKTFSIEIHPGHFHARATSKNHSHNGRFSNIKWIEASRRALRWLYPWDAGGNRKEDVLSEIMG